MTAADGPSKTPHPSGEPIPVVAAVVRDGDRFLLGRRPESKRHGGLWEFPGGKLRPGEDTLAGLRRELDEELALRCRGAGAVLWSARDPGSPFVIDFVEAEVEGRVEAREHEAVGWFTVEELRTMPLAPTDAAFVARLDGEAGASG